jgi:hypothetical protein
VAAVRNRRLLELFGASVVERHGDAAQRRLLRDLGAHRTRPDDSETLECHCTEKIRVTVLRVMTLDSRPSILSLPVISFSATPRPTSS